MITQNRGTIAFAVCGSFCTLEAALQSACALTAQGTRYWTRCRRWSRWAPAKWRRHWW